MTLFILSLVSNLASAGAVPVPACEDAILRAAQAMGSCDSQMAKIRKKHPAAVVSKVVGAPPTDKISRRDGGTQVDHEQTWTFDIRESNKPGGSDRVATFKVVHSVLEFAADDGRSGGGTFPSYKCVAVSDASANDNSPSVPGARSSKKLNAPAEPATDKGVETNTPSRGTQDARTIGN